MLNDRMVDTMAARGLLRNNPGETAFRSTLRHLFLPNHPIEKVYSPEEAIPTKFGERGMAISSSSAPDIMAIMVNQLGRRPGDNVMEIGPGTGYNAAILANLAGPTGRVTSVDIDPVIADTARVNLDKAGMHAVKLETQDGWLGSSDNAPFDRIEVTVGVWDLSPQWLDQLNEGGVLVAPLWLRCGVQASVAFTRSGTKLLGSTPERCGFMRLRGPHAGPELYVAAGTWTACLEGAADEEVAMLSELLQSQPKRQRALFLREGWFTRLAFARRDAIRLSYPTDWSHEAAGLFDPVQRSLALVDRGLIVSFGSDNCAEELVSMLPDIERFDLSSRQVVAVPKADFQPSLAPGGLLITRDDFVYRIVEAADQ